MNTEFISSENNTALWHFIFGNVDDIYPTEPLIYLSFRNYITLQLKLAGYRHIYYIHRAGNLIQAEMSREDKAEFGAVLFTPLIHPLGYSREIPVNDSPVLEYVPQKFGKYLLSRLTEQNYTAVVFMGASALEEIWDYEDLKRLADYSESITVTRHNKLFVASSANASESEQYLSGENSIFRKNPALCPSLGAIISEKCELYSRMRVSMGEECSFLFDLTRERIYLIMKEYLLLEADNNTVPFNVQTLEECTDFVWYWYHSSSMRRKYYTLLPENPLGKTRVLREYLWKSDFSFNSEIRWRNLYQAVTLLKEETGRSVQEVLSDTYRDLIPLAMNYDLQSGNNELKKLADLVNLMKRSTDFANKFWDIQSLVDHGKEFLRGSLQEEMIDIFNFAVKFTERSVKNSDQDTYRRCIGLFRFCSKNNWFYDRKKKINYDAWENILEISGQLFEWKNNIEVRCRKIEEQKQIRDHAFEQVIGQPDRNRKTDADWEIQFLKEQSNDAASEMHRLQNLNVFTSKQISAMNKILLELEDIALTFQEGNAEYMQKKLEANREIQKKVYSEYFSENPEE